MELIVTTPDEIRSIIRTEIKNFFETKSNTKVQDPINSSCLITTTDLSKYLNISEQTVIRWKDKNKIPCVKMGRSIRFHLPSVLKSLEK